MNTPDPKREYFGTALNPFSFQQWLDAIGTSLESGKRRHLSAHHNLHSLYLLRRNNSIAEFYRRCDDCYIDGMPVRLILAGFGENTSAAQRFSLMDRFQELLAHAQAQKWRIYYLGSKEAVSDRSRELIAQQFPTLEIVLNHGYFTDNAAVIAEINELRPDLLLVGMGMPRQECWLLENLELLDIGCATQAGASLDYYADAQAQPPYWISRLGFAWLYRLAKDPVRLWRRYLLEPWHLLPPTLRQWYRHRAAGRAGV
ncbi:MAG: N-acetylglucosaminyldiphosphoundecaprenol N-acetyl-beta-D-mannosaminyltransferase [Halieaceae bacterium]|jgi:N-acetylglucosaminyldiphosphoundecaprenol N-acetyl-beta-D-mannosaminyltransferase